MTTRYFGAAVPRNEDAAPAHRARAVRRRRAAAGHAARRLRAQPARACPHPRNRCVGGARARRRASRSIPHTISATTGSPGPLLVPPPPIDGAVFNERTQVPLAQGQGAPRRRAGRARHRREPLPRRGRGARTSTVDYEPLPAVVDLERALAADAPRVHDDVPGNVAAHVRQARGDYARAAQQRASRDPAPLLLRPRHLVADRDPRRRGAMGRKGRSPHRLGHHAGAGGDPQRPRGDARPVGAPGARHRAVHRRRLRPQDHDVLPGGGADSLGGDASSAAR